MSDNLASISAEAAVLGAMLIDGSVIDTVKDILHKEAFTDSIHQKLYSVLVDLEYEDADLVLVRDEIANRKYDIPVDYLVKLTESTPITANAEYYADIVLEKYKLRRLQGYAS